MLTALRGAGEPSGKPRPWHFSHFCFLSGVIYLIHPEAKIRLLDASVSLACVINPSP